MFNAGKTGQTLLQDPIQFLGPRFIVTGEAGIDFDQVIGARLQTGID